jgi:soluble lytic murein transglycosylase-like protein
LSLLLLEVAIPAVPPLRRLIALGTVALAAIAFTATRVQPIYLDDQLPSLAILAATDDDRALTAAPWLMMPYREALATSTFLRDRNAFALDLVRTGKVAMPRALGLADVAVREAYRRKVPPALVLGVMLTENDEVKSTARSRQGALGLMQIHPGPWRRSLGELFGTNLRNDTTNLRYGVFILGHLSRRTPRGQADTATTWETALLRYNGCVRGTNTRDCKRYPDVVRRRVLRNARTICAGKNFEHCVVTPLRVASRAG